MLDLAERLSAEQARAAELRLEIKYAEEDLQHGVLKLEQMILEKEGKDSLGSNETERKRTLQVKVMENEKYKEKVKEIREMHRNLLSIENLINTLENERRAWEWMIRKDQVAAIMGGSTSDAIVDGHIKERV